MCHELRQLKNGIGQRKIIKVFFCFCNRLHENICHVKHFPNHCTRSFNTCQYSAGIWKQKGVFQNRLTFLMFTEAFSRNRSDRGSADSFRHKKSIQGSFLDNFVKFFRNNYSIDYLLVLQLMFGHWFLLIF